MQKMLIKAISIVPVLLVLLILLIPTPASAASTNTYTDGSGVIWTYTVEDSTSDTCTITKCSQTSGTVSFPDMIEDKTVVVIGDGSRIFNFNNNVTSVVIPDSVISIGNDAFKNCSKLASVAIGNSVTSIGDNAFYYCELLTSITIPDSVISIGNSAFYNCSKLASVTIGNSVTSIGNSAFYYCELLTSITIPDSVTSIGRNVFEQCDALTAINVSEGNAEYSSEDGVLFNDVKTELIKYPKAKTTATYVIPSTVNSIAEYAFSQNTKLKSVTIPESVTSIGAYAFSWCAGLTSISIPDFVTSIEEQTFLGCNQLTSVTIGDSVTSIGDSAFKECYKISSVTIGNSVTSIGNDAFYSNTLLESIIIPDSVISIGAYAFRNCANLSSLIIGNSVTSIGNSAFLDNTSLESVTIPDSVTSIDDTAFIGCTALAAINVNEGNTEYCSEDGILFNKDKTELLKYPIAKVLTTYAIPNSVTTINKLAFDGCSGLASIIIPDSVTTIEESAFQDCTALTAITIPNSVITIERYAFYGCTGLTSITIPDSVTSIGDYAFYRCTSIESVYFTGNAPVISSNAFYGIPKSNFTLYHSDIATGWDMYESTYNTAIGLHIVAFNSNGGSTVDSQVVLSGEKATRPTDPTKIGVIFEGWYKDADFSTPWDFDTETVEASIILYAKWPIVTTVISISEVTGVSIPVTGAAPDVTVDETEQYTATILWLPADATFNGSTVYTATITITPKEGYTLTGVPANFFTVAGAIATNAADSGVVTAVFPETAPITYTVTFNVNGGSAVDAISNVVSGNTITAPTAPTKTGYTFAGWYKEPTYENEWDFASDAVTADITLYAKWTAYTPAPSGSGSGSSTPSAPITETKSGENVPKSNIAQLISNDKTLTVKADNGAMLVFDTEALKGIDDQTSSAIRVEIKDVTPEYQETHSSKIVFSLKVYSKSSTISNFGGKVTVLLPYELKEGERAEDVTVWHLADDGTMTEIPCNYDPVTKLAAIKVTHFSLYVVGVQPVEPWVNPFADVSESDWFYGAIEFANQNGLFMGTGATTFSPSSPMTRAMLWTVVGRLDGQTLTGSDAFEKARIWAMGAGITDGTNPDGNITREQIVTILWRYAGAPRITGVLSKFSDAGSVSDYAVEAMAWAVENGIIVGSNGTLMPKANATRAEVAAIMQRFMEKIAK